MTATQCRGRSLASLGNCSLRCSTSCIPAVVLPPSAEGGCARRHAIGAWPLWYRSLCSAYPTGAGGSPAAPLLLILMVLAAPVAAVETVDEDVIGRIREEGFQRSQVMDIAFEMTDLLGPRLSGSRDMRRAQEWATGKMASLGLVNVAVEPFGEHGVSWDNDYTSIHLIAPDYQPLIGYPYAFTPGTDDKQRRAVRLAVIRRRDDFEQFRGQLAGAIVLSSAALELPPGLEPDAVRFTDEELAEQAGATIASPFGVGQDDLAWDDRIMAYIEPEDRERFDLLAPTIEEQEAFAVEIEAFYKEEGVAVVLDPSPGRDGTVFVAGRPGSRYDRSYASAVNALPRVALTPEHYNRLYRLVSKGHPVEVEVEIINALADGAQASNVFGDLAGTDLADELVMAGGHFDSWHAGTGATDDGAGCAVVLEAVRILKAIGVQPRRTIRVALWSWEEGGKVGSRSYVADYFGSEAQPTPAHEKLSVYFNQDNGTGQFRGIYLSGNERVRPIFEAWMRPFHDLKMSTLTSNNTFGVDIVGFDMAGLPAFQFIQDPIDYKTRTHHSNMDVYDRLVPEDLRKNAVILASFLYHAAMRDQPLPRVTKQMP